MRGNSGFMRWVCLAVLGVLPVMITASPIYGGPVRTRRMMREIYSNLETTTISNIPESTDICFANGKEMVKSAVACEEKPGCRKIETRGECCPTYQCHCELQGELYGNDEKIVDMTTPCHVCVCKGGEIKCNNVTCYQRNDCLSVKYNDGVCCPEYDNCPPLEDNQVNLSKEMNLTDGPQVHPVTIFRRPSRATTIPVTEPSTTSAKPEETPIDPDNPLGIKIKEITKAEEIRITNDKPKMFQPTRTTEFTVSSTTESVTNDAAIIEENQGETDDSILSDVKNEDTKTTVQGDLEELTQFETSDDGYVGDTSFGPKNVRQTEAVIHSAEDSRANDISQSFVSEEKSAQLENNNGHPDGVSVEPVEGLDEQKETIQGSNVVIVDGQSFTLKEAIGLQRGEDEEDDRKAAPKATDDILPTTTTDNPIMSTASPTTENVTYVESTEKYEALINTTYFEPSTDTSTEIFDDNVTHTTEGPFSSLEIIAMYEKELMNNHTTMGALTSAEIIENYEKELFAQYSTTMPLLSSEQTGPTEENLHSLATEDDLCNMSTSSELCKKSTLYHRTSQDTGDADMEGSAYDEDHMHFSGKNPAYPELPDDISLHPQETADVDAKISMNLKNSLENLPAVGDMVNGILTKPV